MTIRAGRFDALTSIGDLALHNERCPSDSVVKSTW